MELKDTGDRQVFGNGAMRDMGGDKGRCDLLPLNVVAKYLDDEFLAHIHEYIVSNNEEHLETALSIFCDQAYDGDGVKMFLEVAKHYEAGAKKYADRNWEKGLPIWNFIDSGVRHYLKWFDDWKDEPHDRAVVWNVMGALWTIYKEERIKNDSEH